ncbi:MAG: glutamate 5-kinase, partial [Phaeodactylibacter sp.]|nr:glutamate 5-kinase [Phaeodactylibacter sp.]MCB9276679.1 glutamate 5-kinase [Lewinellaceae bacterium]
MSALRKIVVKVGTNVLAREDGLLDITSISHLVDQIAALKAQGVEVILVSSGAVGAGRSLFQVPEGVSKVVRRQVLSAIGQVRLMEIYRQLFANHGLFCAQVLATRADFQGKTHYTNMKNCFQALLRDKVVPVVNENDVVSVSELMFTDNDELAGLVAAMTNAQALIILSSVDGLLSGPPGEPGSEVIPEADPADKQLLKLILPSKSSFGRGGMHTKFRIAQKAARAGIATYIANGRRANILLDILKGQYTATRFPATGKLSNLKKRLAYGEGESKAAVHINRGAEVALCAPYKISSLLPVGITRIEGEFEKGDLIRIINEAGEAIGMGLAQYGSDVARQYLGQQGKRALVHYDYLYIG